MAAREKSRDVLFYGMGLVGAAGMVVKTSGKA
jgi:hypothetical protein